MANIIIRAFEMPDWKDVAELFLAPNCQWGTLQMPYQSRDAIRQKLEMPPPNLHRLVAVEPERGKVVGMLGLNCGQHRRAHSGNIGMFVHDDYQDQGIGSKLMDAAIDLADNWLSLTRLELTVYIDNPRAIHLYEKYGFAKEGTLQRYALRDGEYVDAYTMARLKT